MSPSVIVGYVLGVVIIGFTLYAAYLIIWPESLWPKKRVETKKREDEKKRWKYNGRVVVFTIATFHVIGYGILREDWYTYVLTNTWVLVLHIPLIIYGWITPKSDYLYHHVVGKIMIPIIVIVMIVIIVREVQKASPPKQQSNTISTSTGPIVNHSREFLAVNPKGRAEAKKILDEKNLPDGQEDFVLGLFGCESGYRQFEDDGKTPLKPRGQDGKIRTDVDVRGIGQIDMSTWTKELNDLGPDYDPDTMEGNINATLKILNDHGGKQWDCFSRVHDEAGLKEVRQLEAPIGNKWTETFRTGKWINFNISGPIVFRGPDKI